MSATHFSGPVISPGGFVGPVTGAITGNITGDVTGNVTGNVTGDVTGALTGNVTGNVIGNITGDVTGNLTGAVVASASVNSTATPLAITAATHAGRVVTINKADGMAITLPAATGSGAVFKFFVGTTVTSSAVTIKVSSAAQTMSGLAIVAADGGDTVVAFETAADTDTISFNGTTTGGVLGDFVELIDVAANKYYVRVTASATDTEATPFSATVS